MGNRMTSALRPPHESRRRAAKLSAIGVGIAAAVLGFGMGLGQRVTRAPEILAHCRSVLSQRSTWIGAGIGGAATGLVQGLREMRLRMKEEGSREPEIQRRIRRKRLGYATVATALGTIGGAGAGYLIPVGYQAGFAQVDDDVSQLIERLRSAKRQVESLRIELLGIPVGRVTLGDAHGPEMRTGLVGLVSRLAERLRTLRGG